MAELSRQVSRAAADKDDAERERQSLLDALRNSEQVFDVVSCDVMHFQECANAVAVAEPLCCHQSHVLSNRRHLHKSCHVLSPAKTRALSAFLTDVPDPLGLPSIGLKSCCHLSSFL